MANLRFFIDASAIAEQFKELKSEVEKALTEGVQQIASMTYAKTQELASAKLNSTRQTYLNALSFKQIDNGIWVVSLDQPAMFIEEGRKAGDMTEDMLRKNYKVASDGSRYKAIPFDQAKTPSQTPVSAMQYVNQVKTELKARNIPYKKIEYDANGSPRLGKLHTINDIQSSKPSSRASHGALSGLSIYQRQMKNGSVRRDILTFRVVSSKHKGVKWSHPGMDGHKFMESALAWAESEFDKSILPAIMEKFGKE